MTEKTIFFPVVFHFHQPVDNFSFVFDDCFKKSYGPLIDAISKFPDVKVTLHFSGNLLEWFIDNKPEFIEKLKIMAKRGQLELIGGGYYEPIFAIIPTRDKIAQMKKLSRLIKQEFGLDVKGAWLSERVWEPNYPSFLAEVGLEYVILDDNHFRSCGLTEEDTLYSYITEDEGKTLRVFPINETLRYLMPWKPTYLFVDYLKTIADEQGDRAAVFISDAEKMGVWGSTHQLCYVDGEGHWDGDDKKPFIPAFLEQISKNKWIKSISLSEYMDMFPARDLVYLPTASYDTMEEWVLPTKIRKQYKKVRKELRDDPERKEEYQFLRGGFWRYFLVKYPESNNMHKKMLHVREKLIMIEEKLESITDGNMISTLKSRIKQAWDEIYKSQCNDCYWHGMFGGVYLQFLRFSVYTHAINAEKIIDEMNALLTSIKDPFISIISTDFNKDSKIDLLIESNILNAYFNPMEGGTLFELDYKPKSYNILNTLTRWEEAYHDSDKIEAEELMIDRFRRSMLRVRILHDDVTLDQIQEDTYYEFGDYIDGAFIITKTEKEGMMAEIEMEMKGSIKDPKTDESHPCLITKNVKIQENEIVVLIKGSLEEIAGKEERLKSIIENLNIAVDIPFFFNGNPKEFLWESEQVKFYDEVEKDLLEPFTYVGNHFKAHDKSYDLTFEINIKSYSSSIKINKFPIIAYAYTDTGYQKIYQGINITPMIKIKKSFELEFKLKIY